MRARARLITPPGEAAIAVVLVEGSALAATMRGLGVRRLPGVGATGLRRLDLGEGLYEDALLVVPAVDAIEIHTHGNPRLVARLRSALRRLGVDDYVSEPRSNVTHARSASTGGSRKEDTHASLRAEILDVARDAPSRIGLEACLTQLGPDGLLALVADAETRRTERRRTETWDAVDTRGRALEPFLAPRRVVLRGPTNVGKSTLFNLLLGRPRVRVGRDAGLTRDTVEELVVLEGGAPILLVDVAGERELDVAGERELDVASGERGLDAELERRAIEAGASIRKSADLVVALRSCEDPDPSTPEDGELSVWTHADRAPPDARTESGDAIRCSLTEDDPADLARRLGRAIRAALGIELPVAGPAWIGARTRAFVTARRRRNAAGPID